jgi:hypothetical protein
MSGRADRWIRRTTTGCVALLALIAGTVSYLHMHVLVEMHGQPGWVAALTPLSVDGRNCGYGQVMIKLADGLYHRRWGEDLLAGQLDPDGWVDAGAGRRWRPR